MDTPEPVEKQSARLRAVSLLPRFVLMLSAGYLGWVLVPYLLHNNLLKGDGPGHLSLVQLTHDHLLPWGSGWTDRIWGGFTVGELYPPLFHILAALLTFIMPATAAVKTLVVATWAAIAAGLFLVTRALSTDDRDRPHPVLHATLLLAAWCAVLVPSRSLGIAETLGSNPESAIGNGMFPSAAGLAAYLFLLHEVVRPREARAAPIAFSLAAAVVLHPVWGLVGALTATLAGLQALFAARTAPVPVLRKWLFAALWSFALAAFFALPLVANGDRIASTYIPLGWPAAIWSSVGATLCLAVLYWRNLHRRFRLLAGLLLVLVAGALAGDAAGVRFHFYRLTIPVALLVLPLLSYLIFQPWRETRPSRAAVLRRAGNGAMLIALLPILIAAGPVHPRGNPDLGQPDLSDYQRRQGRIAAVSDPMHSPGYMALPWAVIQAGGAVSHGISVESSSAARAIFGVLRKLNARQYVWGVDMHGNPAQRLPDPDGRLLIDQLRLLGFSHVLSDRRPAALKLPETLTGPVALTFPNVFGQAADRLAGLGKLFNLSANGRDFEYRLLPVPGAGLVDAHRSFQGVPSARFLDYTEAWFAMAGGAPVPTADLDGVVEAVAGCAVAVDSLAPGGERLELDVAGCAAWPAPLYVKVPYHPRWEATSADGSSIPVHAAGYGMLVLAPQGPLTLVYRVGVVSWLGRILTLLALALSLAQPLIRRRHKRSL